MPKRATPANTVLINIRFTPEQVERIDDLVRKGVAINRTDFVRDAVIYKLYFEENRVATFHITLKE